MSDETPQASDTPDQPLPAFLFTCCQVGAETNLKAEVTASLPGSRFAFSRPGFVTFKLPEESRPPLRFDLKSVFARTHGFTVGKVSGENAEQIARDAWQLIDATSINHLHVWQRDVCVPGERGFWPGATVLSQEVAERLAATTPAGGDKLVINQKAEPDERIMDCILVEPNEWWIGFHEASTSALRWPGGVVPADLPPYAVSRAYAKMSEALEWSRFPCLPGDTCVEIGSAPGGSAQALIDRGLQVTGIDPAEMDDRVLANKQFHWIRKRGSDLKRREYAGYRWLAADINMAPKFTLDMVEDIVQHESVHMQGLLLTLKLLDWKLAAEIPSYLDRIRSWGYRYVRARQLALNRQEICVVALKSRASRRGRPKR